MAKEKANNSFCSPESRSVGTDHSNSNVRVYELVSHYEAGPSKKSSDFRVFKKQECTEEYDSLKRIAAETKGNDLKSIIARCQKTQDFSILERASEAVYGDEALIPDNLSDQMQRGVDTSAYLDSLSAEEKEKYIRLSKMNESEFNAYIQSLVDAKIAASGKQEEKGEGEK